MPLKFFKLKTYLLVQVNTDINKCEKLCGNIWVFQIFCKEYFLSRKNKNKLSPFNQRV